MLERMDWVKLSYLDFESSTIAVTCILWTHPFTAEEYISIQSGMDLKVKEKSIIELVGTQSPN